MFTKKHEVNVIYKVPVSDPAYYSLKKFKGNRPTVKLNVERIKKSMEKRNFLNCIPIIVDARYRIIDGQNRYEAAKSLGHAIHVIQINDTDLGQIAIALNTNKRNWTLLNFAHYWAEQEDNPEAAAIYQRFLDYKENNNITCGILIAIFNMKSSRGIFLKDGGNKDFKEGRLPFGTVNRRHIEDTLSKLRQLKEASLYSPILRSTFRKQQFQEAFLQAMKIKCFNFDKFLCKLCRSRHILNKLAKKTDIHDEIVRIYTKKGK
jgi:hypothetical protein